MSVPASVVRAVSFFVTVVTLNALFVYDAIMPGTSMRSTTVVLVIMMLLAFNAGLSGFMDSFIRDDLVIPERMTDETRSEQEEQKPSIEAVKERYVEDDDYTIYDMEEDMDELLEEEELE